MDDITDATSAVVYDTTDGTSNPRDIPLENSSKPTSGSSLAGGSSLDSLFAKQTNTTDSEETEVVDENAADGTDAGVPETKPATKPTADVLKPGGDPKKPTETTAPTKPTVEEPKDKLAEVQLPPHAKPATVKSFNEVKNRARTEISGLQAKIKDLETKIPAAGKLPIELEKELTELREFRKVHDFQNDTEFKTNFVAPVAANNESILAKLKASGYSDENLAKVKTIGIDKLDWDPVLAALPPATRRSIESLLMDNERVSEKRAQAVEAAKKNPTEYAAKQQKVEQDRTTAEESVIKQTVDGALSQLEWFKEQPVPANATAAQIKDIGAKNAFHKEQNDRLKFLLSDKSPEMRGQMIVATLLAYQKQAEANDFKSKYEKANVELEKIRKASSTRSSRNAPATTTTPSHQGGLLISGRQALDDLRKQVDNSE